ncbi:MAG: tyrosine--tRNA ligase [Candidatus Colwellbacteria bacterium RBG_13_48_8]|uniref:Tyrosine--tRNA ligase n=1 Tax=Candidatus Colwellbacteria bacterium RBG_13_48_8 TaxID=1797685 RepID=A0A1G1YY29_9BACT|nr:MAG: tyrosine--tRNA ligase [Candidatus Colwellbacteria bacterium RBG_13_48_8]
MKSSRRPSKPELVKTILGRGVDRVIERQHLELALNSPRKLRVKLGIDPTSPDLHLGHSVVLRKLRQFQDLGHKVVFIIGDFTGQIGDPSGQSKERKILSEKEVRGNMGKYLSQAGKIIDLNKVETRYNSEWLGKNVKNLLLLAQAGTVQQVIQRADFRARIKQGRKVTLLETFYPLLQGFDSVNIKADVEIGGTDQLLNMLMGRQVQSHFGMPQQDVLTVPLIEGTDGVRKMSKSYGNYIGLNDLPKDMFGKIMSISDGLVSKYFDLCTDIPQDEIKKDMDRLGPRDRKIKLAREIVTLYHGEKEAGEAEQEFVRVFQKKELPQKVPVKTVRKLRYNLAELLVTAGLAASKSEARRLITQGGVRMLGEKVLDPHKLVKSSSPYLLIKIGKKKFLRIRFK